MGDLAELDAAVQTLLLDAQAHERFARDPLALGWPPRVITLLQAADAEDLRKLSRAIVKGVSSGALCGIDLRAAFRSTLGLLAPPPQDEALERFVASPEFRRVRAVGNVAGYSSARAFHDWVCATQTAPDIRATAQREYVRATLVALASVSAAYFDPDDPLIHRVADGWIAVLDGEGWLSDAAAVPVSPLAFGAVRGRFWTVPLSLRSAAALLRAAHVPPAWAATRVTDEEAAAVQSALRAKGIL